MGYYITTLTYVYVIQSSSEESDQSNGGSVQIE
jgi:hypothetical protein